MRCMKCGYVTFDVHDECPKCGKSLPASLVTVSAGRSRRRGGGGASYLSPLTLNPIPRFFGNEEDPEVVSLLGEASELVSAPVADRGQPPSVLDEPASEVEVSSPPEEVIGSESVVEDEADTAERDAGDDISPDEMTPADNLLVEEKDAGNQSDPSATLDEVEGLEEANLAAGEGPVPEDSGENTSEVVAEVAADDAPPPEASAPEASEEQGQGDADDLWAEAFAEQEAAEGSGAAEVVSEAVSEGAVEVPEVEADAPPEGGGGEDDADDLWGEAFAEQAAAEAGEPAETVEKEGEEDVEDMWAEAFAEQEAAEGGEAAENADAVNEVVEGGEAAENAEAVGEAGAEVESGAASDDDISNMWDEAFADQEAAENAGEDQGGDSVAQDEGELSDVDESEMEKLWGEALGDSESAGDVPADSPVEELPEESAGEASDGEASDSDVVSQADLDALLGGGDEPEAGLESAGASGAFDDGKMTQSLEGLDIDEEIEAFIVDEGEVEENPAEDAEVVVVGESTGGENENEAVLSMRLFAGAVDAGVVGGFEIVFMVGTHLIISGMAGPIFSNMEALAVVLALDLVVLFLLSMLYSVYFVGGWGRTPGQQLAGLAVVDLGDRPVGYMQAVLRYFGTLVAALPVGLGHLLTVLDKQGRGLGDRLAGTKVVCRNSG